MRIKTKRFLFILAGLLTLSLPIVFAVDNEIAYTQFEEHTGALANPGRGWHSYDYDNADELKRNNITLVMLEADLGKYKARALDSAMLDSIRRKFDCARSNNCSVIFRAAYDFNGVKKPEPSDFNLILAHIDQLKQIFDENADILYVIQAGFLGPWGEWHNSLYGAPPDGVPSIEAQKAVFYALCGAAPDNVYIEVRRPSFARGIMGDQAITELDAFTGAPLSRIAIHNDAIFNGKDDDGTYVQKGWGRAEELAWQDNHNRYAPFIAESDALKDESKTGNAIYELGLLHASSLNLDYYPSVIERWKNEKYAGVPTFDYIGANLGYRFVVKRAGITANVKRGGVLNVKLDIENKGFGGLLQEKDFEVVITDGAQTFRAKVADDARKWHKGNGLMNKDYFFSVPTDMAAGTWKVYASLSDVHESLKNNPAYSVRFANAGMWESGMNLLGTFTVLDQPAGNGQQGFSQIDGGDRPTPTETPIETPAAIAPPGEDGCFAAVANDAGNLYFTITGNNLNAKSQLFINADGDESTGYKYDWKSGGIDYLIENKTLYRHAGNSKEWNFRKVAGVDVAKAGGEIQITVPLPLIGAPSGGSISFGFISDDIKSTAYPPVASPMAPYVVK